MENKQNFFVKYRKLVIFAVIMVIIILIEAGITIGVHFALKQSDSDNVKIKMKSISENIINEFDKIMDIYRYALVRSSSFFRIHGPLISTEEYLDMLQLLWFPFTNITESNIFVYKLANSELNAFQDFCNQSIVPNCTITEINASSETLIPVNKSRPYYWPVIFYQSITQNTDALIGFDFMQYPATAYIIQQGLASTTNFTMSFRITLTAPNRLNPNNHAVLISNPAFKNNTEQNTSDIYGFNWVIPRVGSLFDYAISKINISIDREDIDLFVFDITKDGFANNTLLNISLLYKENKPEYSDIWFVDNMTQDISTTNYIHSRFGRPWSIYFKFSDHFINVNDNNQKIIIPAIMGGIFLLIDIIIAILYLLILTILKRVEVEKERKTIAVQMLGYVNHEVRNPLNVIKGLAQFTLDTLREFDKGEDEVAKLDKILLNTVISDLCTVCGACDMLEHIVMDILDIRKLESKKLDLDNRNINIDEFMKDLVKTISQKINEKQIEFNLVYDKELIIVLDPYRLKQILLNFLTNAVKYTDEGSITLKEEMIKDNIRFSIIDTGRGINDGAKDRIFQPFNQVTAQDSTRYGGIGLGLYLCKMLAERMDGTIGFTSEYGKGSTFWVEFPRHDIPKLDDASKFDDVSKPDDASKFDGVHVDI